LGKRCQRKNPGRRCWARAPRTTAPWSSLKCRRSGTRLAYCDPETKGPAIKCRASGASLERQQPASSGVFLESAPREVFKTGGTPGTRASSLATVRIPYLFDGWTRCRSDDRPPFATGHPVAFGELSHECPLAAVQVVQAAVVTAPWRNVTIPAERIDGRHGGAADPTPLRATPEPELWRFKFQVEETRV
jgi:hypothetical protein